MFSNIYLRANPDRSTELIEYNQVIHKISLTYSWENVYMYDKDFCIHMSKHPERNWGMILQQAWALHLKDKFQVNQGSGNNHNHNGNDGKGNKPFNSGEICRRYNKGQCPFGSGCNYKHRCSYCYRFGHTVLNCRKLQAGKERGKSSRQAEHYQDHKPSTSHNHRTQPAGHEDAHHRGHDNK